MSNLPAGVEVHKATESESLIILSEPQILKRLELSDASSVTGSDHTYYILTYKGYKMQFSIEEIKEGIYEAHIAIPRDSIKASRVLVLAGMTWVFEVGAPASKAILTSCPEGKIANMCRKTGFTEIKKEGDLIYFLIKSPS